MGKFGWIVLGVAFATFWGGVSIATPRMPLEKNWTLQSSAKAQAPGSDISRVGYRLPGALGTTVPNTVVGAQVQAGAFGKDFDPYFGMNLRAIPGGDYPIGANFSKLPMPENSPYRASWWYRTEFDLDAARIAADRGGRVWLNLDALNFRANVWMNGQLVASKEEIAGAYRVFVLDVTKFVRPGANALAIEIFAAQPEDLGITWVDWAPAPADKNMGLWREAYLTFSGPVQLRHPYVATKLNLPRTDQARLTVSADLVNGADARVSGTLSAVIEDPARTRRIGISQKVELAAGESREVVFAPEQFPDLVLANPALWWPYQMGAQNRYSLELRFDVDTDAGQVASDQRTTRFGIREITSRIGAGGGRQFQVNGKNILIRGAGWAPDLLLRPTPEREEAQVALVKNLGLNTIRMEGKLESDRFLEITDRAGVLVMAGWCCCDQWELWPKWDPEDHTIAGQSLRDQIQRLRQHPSVYTWLYGSDNPPPSNVEQMYLNILKQLRWQNPVQSSASGKKSAEGTPTGYKMSGPYDFVAPSYWLEDKSKFGGAWGFNSETSPGAAPPPVDGLREFLPSDQLWPVNEVWNLHGAGTSFKDSPVFNGALAARYGAPADVEDYALKAQVQAYESHRAMFEAYSRNKYVSSTGVIQWMLNNAWPSTFWHLYDYSLRPAGSYFGAKKANERVHIQYSYDDQSVVLVNQAYVETGKLMASVQVFNLDMTEMYGEEREVSAGADASARVMRVPPIQGLSTTYFVSLKLTKPATGELVSRNFYWLSTQPDVSDWAKSDWKYTPIKVFADYQDLMNLPKVQLQAQVTRKIEGLKGRVRVRLTNPSDYLAFFTSVKLRDAAGREILPVFWSDNDVSLLPGESRDLEVTYRLRTPADKPAQVEISGWNAVRQVAR
jgi:exo-1,4-beta-D-glucosaminidase